MDRLVEQLDRRVAELARWLEVDRGPPAVVRIVREDTLEARRVDFDDSGAATLDIGGAWREPLNTTVWLRFHLTRPPDWPIDETALVARRFGTYPVEANHRIGLDLQRMQGLLYLDGRP